MCLPLQILPCDTFPAIHISVAEMCPSPPHCPQARTMITLTFAPLVLLLLLYAGGKYIAYRQIVRTMKCVSFRCSQRPEWLRASLTTGLQRSARPPHAIQRAVPLLPILCARDLSRHLVVVQLPVRRFRASRMGRRGHCALHAPREATVQLMSFQCRNVLLGECFSQARTVAIYCGPHHCKGTRQVARYYHSYFKHRDSLCPQEVIGARARFPKATKVYELLATFGTNIVVTEGAEWKRQRKIAAPAFSEVRPVLFRGRR